MQHSYYNNKMNPTSWSTSDVADWARRVGLSESTITGLSQNEIDGPTLVTLDKDELRSELGISSLPARRYLWDLILALRSRQESSDRTTAVDILEEEIDLLLLQGSTADAGGGSTETDEEVVNQLRRDATQERQIISDHMMALRLQSFGSQQTYEDAELARAEEERLRQLSIQSEFDRRYVLSFDQRGMERSVANYDENRRQIASLFGLSIQACVSNKVNVAEALANGQIRVIPRLQDLQGANKAEDQMVEFDMISTRDFLNNLPFIDRCDACLEDGKQGFVLACECCLCICCTRELFFAAVRDSSLLPLRCCEIPIDMSISRHILPEADTETLELRVAERECSNKMYCPTCNKFINLDYVDAQESTELMCICDTVLCISCKSTSHPRFTCVENRAIIDGDDTLLLELARQKGWKQCRNCNAMIELTYGCNHITCSSCSHQFCFKCLSPWGGRTCSTGGCEVCYEDRLLAAGEARVGNRAIIDGNDTLLLELARQEGWKQCRNCNAMIELTHGCNHITCLSCSHQFCFKCLSPWGGRTCSTGGCEVWDEDRLLAAGEARVEA